MYPKQNEKIDFAFVAQTRGHKVAYRYTVSLSPLSRRIGLCDVSLVSQSMKWRFLCSTGIPNVFLDVGACMSTREYVFQTGLES